MCMITMMIYPILAAVSTTPAYLPTAVLTAIDAISIHYPQSRFPIRPSHDVGQVVPSGQSRSQAGWTAPPSVAPRL